MNARLKQVPKHSFVPVVLLALVVNLVWFLPKFYPDGLTAIPAAPVLLIAVGLVLSLAFNRSRFTLMQLTLLTAWIAHEQQWGGHRTLPSLLVNAWVIFNFALISLFKDRGLFSVHGALRVSLLFAEINISLYALHYFSEPMARWAVWQVLPLPLLERWWQWPQTLLWLSCLSMAVVFIKFVFSLRHIEAGLLGALTAFLLAINHTANPYWYDLLMGGAALILCVAILLDSFHMAYRDELTGIPARRALNQLLLSLGSRYTIAMLDVDHFKKFNDTHGHDVGDQVLKMVAQKIAEVSGGGRGFRYGGEEFTIVFAGKTIAQAEPHLEAVREAIAHYRMTVRSSERPKGKEGKGLRGAGGGSKELSVTISIGVAERGGELNQPEQVIKAADQALYRAKKKGRNCLSK
ncbi:MAG TPA: GGDEF domain-containing protein [Pseudomonadales bacterium]